jgi:hypothetical protein
MTVIIIIINNGIIVNKLIAQKSGFFGRAGKRTKEEGWKF